MPRRKRAATKRTRRSPYERSLDYATTRLQKAIGERDKAAQQLADLDKEIPYLQTVIRALTPPEKRTSIENFMIIGKQPRNGPVGIAIPASVKPFVEPISPNVDELPGEDEKFLNVSIPGEKELLP